MLLLPGRFLYLLLPSRYSIPILPTLANAHEIIGYSSWYCGSRLSFWSWPLEAYSRSLLKTIVPNLLREIVARHCLRFWSPVFYRYLNFHQFIIGTAPCLPCVLKILTAYSWKIGSCNFPKAQPPGQNGNTRPAEIQPAELCRHGRAYHHRQSGQHYGHGPTRAYGQCHLHHCVLYGHRHRSA